MRLATRALLFLELFVAFEWAVAQSLSPCAQVCIGKTKTKCRPTDYACACAERKYVTRLTECIKSSCDDGEIHDATWYLSSLCNAVGAPLPGTTSELQLELRDTLPIEKRQIDASFTRIAPSATPTSLRTSARGTASSSPTIAPANGSGTNNGRGGGGLSTGAKVGLGLGVPIGVLSVVGAIILAFWFGRKTKEEKVAAAALNPQQPSHPGQPQMMQQGATPQIPQQGSLWYGLPPQHGGPAELSQAAQYIGHEMPTKGGNAIEMPASHTPVKGSVPFQGPSPPPGYVAPQQEYKQPQPLQPQQQYYPPPQQQTSPVPVSPGQIQYPAPGQQWSQQTQPAAELTARRKTPNMYE